MPATPGAPRMGSEPLTRQVVGMILQDAPFPSPSPLFRGWTSLSVSSVLSSLPRFLLLPHSSVGRQRPPPSSRPLLLPPATSSLAVRRALHFYSWLRSHCDFLHSEPTCRSMALFLARARRPSLLWRFLRSNSLHVNTATVTAAITALAEEGLPDHAFTLFHRMRQLRCKPDVQCYNVLIAALCSCERLHDARTLLVRMELPGFHCPPDTYTYTVLIAAYCRRAREVGQRKAVRRRMWEANHMFRRMVFKGFEPDVVTYNCLINGLCKTYRIGRAHELFDEMLVKGCQPNRVTYNSFVRYYCKVNEVDKAVEMMRNMVERGHGEPTTSSYTPIIHTLCEVGRVKEAKCFLEEMVGRGFVPREFTYKLVCDALVTSGEESLRCEDMMKAEEGIRARRDQLKWVKPFMPCRRGYS